MTAPLNIVFYCSFRFYRDSFAEPAAMSGLRDKLEVLLVSQVLMY